MVIDDPPRRRDAEEFAEAVSPAHDHIGLPANGLTITEVHPERRLVKRWYNSPEYQKILPGRLDNSIGRAFIVEGVS